MNHAILTTMSIIVVGVFALVMINSAPIVHAQFIPTAQPCVNNGTNILGPPGKQIVNQENQCTGTNTATGICPTGSVLQNGLCVPTTTGICGTNAVLQNGVCVPISSNCPIGTVLQNGVCVPISSTCPIGTVLQNGVCVPFPNPIQSAPVAVATVSPSSTVGVNTTVTLIGSSSFATTSGATINSYSWDQTSGPFVTLNPNPNTANPNL